MLTAGRGFCRSHRHCPGADGFPSGGSDRFHGGESDSTGLDPILRALMDRAMKLPITPI